jgi:conjugative relaxase-like TrwC/TraI family protein
LTGDDKILSAFRDSVKETMDEMEAEMKTRVRKGDKDQDRVTGNMVWAEFIHTTSRPVDGLPDPQLHAHVFVFNTTWDEEESRWKAGQFADIKRDAPYFQAAFRVRLAGKLQERRLHDVVRGRTPLSRVQHQSRRVPVDHRARRHDARGGRRRKRHRFAAVRDPVQLVERQRGSVKKDHANTGIILTA